MMYSFISDAFPTWKDKEENQTKLYENFSSPDPTEIQKDMDLKVDYPLQTQKGSGPHPFDSSSDYMKILSGNWENTMNQYQSSARAPFQMEEFAPTLASKTTNFLEEEQLGSMKEKRLNCLRVADHLEQCNECKQRIEQIFQKVLARPVPVIQPNMLSLLLLLLLGILIIFVLDGFVKLGRYFR